MKPNTRPSKSNSGINRSIRIWAWWLALGLSLPAVYYTARYVYRDLSAIAQENESLRVAQRWSESVIAGHEKVITDYETRLLRRMEDELPLELSCPLERLSTRDRLIEGLLAPVENKSKLWQVKRFENLHTLIQTPEQKIRWAPRVVEMIDDGLVGEPHSCWATFQLLAFFGSAAKSAIPKLERKIDYEYPQGVIDVGSTILAIDPNFDMMPHLVKTIETHPDNGPKITMFLKRVIPREHAIRMLRQAIDKATDPAQRNQLNDVLLSIL